MPRVLCIWFPRWPIQRLRRERPELSRAEVILFTGRNQRLLVSACDVKSGRAGVRIGQPLTEARLLLPRAACLPADFAADRMALAGLAIDAQRFTPLVGLEDGDHPEALLGDVTGCTHLWGGEDAFLGAVRDFWVESGYHARSALAGSVGSAWAFAHTSIATAVPAGDEEGVLSGLPVGLLRLPDEALDRLASLDLRTIGDVLRLPRESLTSRFGSVLPRRIDQALGLLPETIACERLREPWMASREWETPIEDRFAVALVCRQLLGELLASADHPGAGLQELEGELRTEAGPVVMAIRLVEPSRDERHLAKLIDLQLERVSCSGGVLAIRWKVLRLGRLPQVQRHWLEDDREADTSSLVVALVDRLSSRLGDGAVLRAELVPDAQPEHAVRLAPWTEHATGHRTGYAPSPEFSRSRPLRLLREPQSVAVISAIPDGPPVRVTWRGRRRDVARCWGPERIATGWWRSPDVHRDYYRAEWDDGSHVWIYRDGKDGRWFLHGFFE